jgi:hypothetical protein
MGVLTQTLLAPVIELTENETRRHSSEKPVIRHLVTSCLPSDPDRPESLPTVWADESDQHTRRKPFDGWSREFLKKLLRSSTLRRDLPAGWAPRCRGFVLD